MSKRIVITEDEKNRIKSLYNINEQGIGAGAIIPALFSSIFSISDEESNYGTSSGSVDEKWEKISEKVIDKFEGGYWNGKTPNNIQKTKLGICTNHPEGSMV